MYLFYGHGTEIRWSPWLSAVQVAHAEDEVYQWTDESGRVHFTTAPSNTGTRPKSLPRVGRENIDQRIKTIREQTPANCEKHGGIDCAQGADADGSVVCLDGYREAILPFQFACMEARLQVEFSVVTTEGESPHKRDLSRTVTDVHPARQLLLSVRNLSGVEAYGIIAEFLVGRRRTLRAEGPDRIPAFGNAGYSFDLTSLPDPLSRTQLEQASSQVRCTNCGAIRGSRQ